MSEALNMRSLGEAQRRMILGEARFLLVPFTLEGERFSYDTRGLVPLSALRRPEELAQAMGALEKLPRLLEEFFLEEELVDFSFDSLCFSPLSKEIRVKLSEGREEAAPVSVLSRSLTARFEEELLNPQAEETYLLELVYLLRAFLMADDVEEAAARYLSEAAARRLAAEEAAGMSAEPEKDKSSLLKNVFDGIMNHKAFS